MSIFVVLMIAGLFGMALMAIPGLNRHGHAGIAGHTHIGGHISAPHSTGLASHAGHVGHASAAAAHLVGKAGSGQSSTDSGSALLNGLNYSLFRLLQPRVLFTLMALYGAFGYGIVGSHLLTPKLAALAAILPTLLFERFAVTPLWNMLLGFQGKPCSPLADLTMHEAQAVTPFRNGKGIVQVVRDGRAVQLSARLAETQKTMPVRVGDCLRIEEVDTAQERVTVSHQ